MTINSDSGPCLPEALEILALASSLNSIVDVDTLLQKIGDTAERLLDCEGSSIMLLDETGKTLQFRVATGAKGTALKKMELPVGQGVAGWVAAHAEAVLLADVASDKRFAAQFDRATGYETRSLMAVPLFTKGAVTGVAEVVNKKNGAQFTQADMDLLRGLAEAAAVAVSNARMIRDHKNFFSHLLELLASTIETAKPGMESHTTHSAYLACAVGRRLGVSEGEYRSIYYAGLLHDIGYIGMKSPRLVRDAGLLATASAEDLHVVMSARMLEGINILQSAIPLVLHHHENFDGTGFPGKLAGTAIPLGARILRLIESMEELRMAGGLRGEPLKLRAVKEARAGAGTRFDPRVADAFVQLLEEGEHIWEI